ncbi:MAG: tetratricopeptide repeat protein [Treponemataceae bacterium]|nr:tetratricopeptide repeat protein [Treponemataceae bacterium]
MKAGKISSLPLVLVFFSLFCTGCASRAASWIVPNEQKVVIQNLASEYASLADSYVELKKYSKAVEFYQKSLAIDSTNNQTIYSLAKAYTLNKQWNEAENLYRLLLTADPENTTFQLYLAYIYAQKDEFQKALELYESLYEKNPLNTNVLTNYGLILVHEGNLQKAEQLLSELLVLNESGEGTKKLSDAVKKAQSSES